MKSARLILTTYLLQSFGRNGTRLVLSTFREKDEDGQTVNRIEDRETFVTDITHETIYG